MVSCTFQTMRLNLFSEGDNVLLLGEGNFSFARSLVTHNLPISITATCLDNGVKYKHQQENIKFLTESNIPVFLDVDATKLHEHPMLKSQVFSKIIFNFPHVGGKMKIQLNRILVRKVCESSSHLIGSEGLLIISLCNGQGGTPADVPQRKWDDSWQITEMAAYGDFCLISVEPFDVKNFQLYSCTGYRSQDTFFNLNGALVHIFRKKVKTFKMFNYEKLQQRLSLVPLSATSDILVPFYYSELYAQTPLNRPKSVVSFFQQLLLNQMQFLYPEDDIKILDDEYIPILVNSAQGVICECNGNESRLRSSAVQNVADIVKLVDKCGFKDKIIFFPGMYFNESLEEDFHKTSPISFQFLIFGKCVSTCFHMFLENLVTLFHKNDLEIKTNSVPSAIFTQNPNERQRTVSFIMEQRHANYKKVGEWHYVENNINNAFANELSLGDEGSEFEAFIIYVDKLAEMFFGTKSWKEIWSEDSIVHLSPKNAPILNQGIMYPSHYHFDITLKYDTNQRLSVDDVYETLRKTALGMIKEVKVVNEYNSGEEWSSTCFRITYQSLSEPLHRDKVLEIHNKVIAQMLTLALPVTIK